jgi:hypothetical protein
MEIGTTHYPRPRETCKSYCCALPKRRFALTIPQKNPSGFRSIDGIRSEQSVPPSKCAIVVYASSTGTGPSRERHKLENHPENKVTFIRFPHTPHVAWLGPGVPRGDKVLTPEEASAFLSGPILVEEKIDGANLGLSIDEEGELRAQNRGSFLAAGEASGQWKPLPQWLNVYRTRLADALFPDLMLFGEWCYAVHSVQYSQLPDWFVTFDVYDRSRREFWSVARRNRLAGELGFPVVPCLGSGVFTLNELTTFFGPSRFGDSAVEGIYLRRESQDCLLGRAKLVRGEFTQAIARHWSSRPLVPNRLAVAGPPPAGQRRLEGRKP